MYVFQHYLYELIINILVHNNCFYQLHQFLQYHVLQDSKPLVRMNIYTLIEYSVEYTENIHLYTENTVEYLYTLLCMKRNAFFLMRTKFDGDTFRKRRLLFCKILQNNNWQEALKTNVFLIGGFTLRKYTSHLIYM